MEIPSIMKIDISEFIAVIERTATEEKHMLGLKISKG